MAKGTSTKRTRAKGRGRTKPRRATRRRKPKPAPFSYGIVSRIRAICAGRRFDEVCAATGIHEENVRRFWHGMNQPSIDFVTSLCLAYGVSAHWLLTGLGPRRLRR